MAVVGAPIPILTGGTAELRHGDYDRIFGKIAEVYPEGAQRLRELPQHIGDLALCAAFVDMVVPAADVGKCHLYAQVGLDELGELFKTVAKTPTRIVRARRRLVLRGIG